MYVKHLAAWLLLGRNMRRNKRKLSQLLQRHDSTH
jgi:hypothetical protein